MTLHCECWFWGLRCPRLDMRHRQLMHKCPSSCSTMGSSLARGGCQIRILELLWSTTWNKWIYLFSSVSPWWEAGSPGKVSGAQKWDKNCSLCTGWRELCHFCAGLCPRLSQWAQGDASSPKNHRNCKWNAQISVGDNVQTQQVDVSCARVSWELIRTLGSCSLHPSPQAEQPLNLSHSCLTATTCNQGHSAIVAWILMWFVGGFLDDEVTVSWTVLKGTFC